MGVLAFVVCFTISCLFTSIFQCTPVHIFWDTLAGHLAPILGGKCINVDLYLLVGGAIDTATNFVLLALVGAVSIIGG